MDIKVKATVKSQHTDVMTKDLIEEFMRNSQRVENETLKVDRNLFVDAAQLNNVQFEFINLQSLQLNKKSFQVCNAKNAIVEAQFGIAETGHVVFDTRDDNTILAISMADTLHVVLPASKILQSCMDLELVKGACCSEMTENINCVSGVTRNDQPSKFGPPLKRTLVYVIEDL